jgi:hypothetical protein
VDGNERVLNPDALRDSVAFSVCLAQAALAAIETGAVIDPAGDAALLAARSYVAGGTRNHALRRAAMDAYRAAQLLGHGPEFHALHSASAAAGAAFLHPPGGRYPAHQTKHILGAAAHFVLCIEALGGDATETMHSVIDDCPESVRMLLSLYPEPPPGTSRYSVLWSELYMGMTNP